MAFTVWKRGRQIIRIEKKLNQYLYEQEKNKEGKTEKTGKEDGNGDTAGPPT